MKNPMPQQMPGNRFESGQTVALEALPLLIPNITDKKVQQVLRDKPFRYERRGLQHWALGESVNKYFNLNK